MGTNAYLEEYSQQGAVKRYLSKTAGTGISFLLTNVYSSIYQNISTGCTKMAWAIVIGEFWSMAAVGG
jgi:hypothetical protein